MPWYKWRHGFVLEMQAAADQEAEQLQQVQYTTNLDLGISSTQIESYKADVQRSAAKLEKLKAKLEEVKNDKQALLEQMRIHQEQLDTLHPTDEIVNLRDEFEKLQHLHLWHALKLEEKQIACGFLYNIIGHCPALALLTTSEALLEALGSELVP
ncbi:hypothetical protein FRC07_014447 [Ceratobasidium sp. 392]|nr:hypothetical protein FRC07_014447 [Ceratobasidium sp. 392]